MATTLLSYDPLCNSYTTPDPDIGGIGVIASIVVQSSFVLIISLYRSYLELRHGAAGTHKDQMAIMDKILLMCSDVQGVLGLSMLIAALSQIHHISLYHSFIAWHIIAVISLSHLAAVYYTFNRSFRYVIPRLCVIFVSLWLFCALGIIVWLRHLNWVDKPGMCYRKSLIPPSPHNSVAHMAVSVIVPTLYCVLYVFKFDPYGIRLDAIVTKWPSSRRLWIFVTSILHVIVFGLALLGIFSVYASSRPLLVANNGLGEREQERWGFGQFIAMLSVLAIGIETYNIFHEESSEHQVRDKKQELEDRLMTAHHKVQDLEGRLLAAQDRILQLEN